VKYWTFIESSLSPSHEFDEDLLPRPDLLHVLGHVEEAGESAARFAVAILNEDAAGSWKDNKR